MLNCLVLRRDASQAIAVDTDHNRLQRVGQGKFVRRFFRMKLTDRVPQLLTIFGRLTDPSINKQKKIKKSLEFCWHLASPPTKRAGSVIQWYGSGIRIHIKKSRTKTLVLGSDNGSGNRISEFCILKNMSLVYFFCKLNTWIRTLQLSWNADPNVQIEFA